MDDNDFYSLKLFIMQTNLTYAEARQALVEAVQSKDAKIKALKEYAKTLPPLIKKDVEVVES